MYKVISVLLLAALLLGGCATRQPDIVLHTQAPTRPDDTPPRILGVRDLTVYAGGTIAYRSGVTVDDDVDPAPTLTVDSSGVDLTTAGVYQVTYTALDAAGNTAHATAAVTVLAKEEAAGDLAAVYEEADRVLEKILGNADTPEEQVRAIYSWARSSLRYGGHSDRTDWRQTAYTMLTEGKGDCYGYFAVTKLLLERLGIPNIDVQKVRNFEEDSDHFWSLVSVDGGETYYHFDATPRVGDGDDFCLVTDAFLDAYSAAHKNCHNRDSSQYPATPEETP